MNLPLNSNFAFAFLLLPARRRRALAAAYGFCREVDDAVDEVTDEKTGLQILQTWRSELALVFEGTPKTASGLRLQHAAREFDIHRGDLEDILHGVEMDLVHKRYEDFEQLYRYCYRVASAVGMVAISIFGAPGAREYAEKLGLALQLTNILRDVREDAGRGRIYLPLADLKRFGVSENDILQARMTPAFRDLMAFEAARAQRYYDEARAAYPREKRHALAAAEAMGAIYHALLESLRVRAFDVFHERVSLSVPKKLGIALRAGIASI